MILTRKPIRVFCVDDHAFLVEGLQARLSLARDMEFVGRLSSAEDIVTEVKRTVPDVVLMDIEMPGPDPFEALEDLRRQCPKVRVMMLSAYVRDHYIDAAVNAGAWGYLSKHDDPEKILHAIRDVANGAFVFGPQVMERCSIKKRGGINEDNQPTSKIKNLTSREQQVLRLIGKGLSRAEIAKTLSRSPKTIDAHRAAIMEKMDIHDRTELALFAVREGLVEA
ncbi:MAG: response regulator transcription factor [Phycisphaerales bacterium]|nr:response regulator transcription factor [Phycisphaerales bacterium]MCI0630101.1 response regulator transcription factor [Phycisphaerales bacterium]MCI0677227.1 response regulator transcription factor [Phycisphaerales bacterium]